MPSTARKTRRATRQFVTVAVGAFALSVGSGALVSAHAQSAYSYSSPSVTVDYSVLNRLGPAPQVPDSRFMLHTPTQAGTHRVALGHSTARRSRAVAQQSVHRPARVVAQAHPTQRVAAVVQDGNVTIDYGALAALNPASGPRIVLRRPGTATVAAAAPAAAQPEAPLTPPPVHSATQQAAVLTLPASRPAPSPAPAAPPPPRVATAPSAPETR